MTFHFTGLIETPFTPCVQVGNLFSSQKRKTSILSQKQKSASAPSPEGNTGYQLSYLKEAQVQAHKMLKRMTVMKLKMR